MGRLTAKNSQGYWSLKGVQWNSLCEGQVITKDIQQRLTGALCKLKDYEDIGYSPENVEHIRYVLEDAARFLFPYCRPLDLSFLMSYNAHMTKGCLIRKLRRLFYYLFSNQFLFIFQKSFK